MSLGWRTRAHLVACPLEGPVVPAVARFPMQIAVRESSMMGVCPSQPSREPLDNTLSEVDDGRN
jgi:hypothetical protein